MPTRRIAASWRLTSFSSLASGLGSSSGSGLAADRASEGLLQAAIEPDVAVDLDPDDLSLDALAAPEAGSQDEAAGEEESIFTFPRGARAGTCLHAILEGIDFTDRSPGHLAAQVEAGLAGHGFEARWQPVIERMVRDVLEAHLGTHPGAHPGAHLAPNLAERLDGGGYCRLAEIPRPNRLVEMEFHFPARGLTGSELDALLARRRPGTRPPLGTERIRGFVKGFIDLIFRYQGRFFIADYKSNHLGNRPQDYQGPRLEEAVFEHFYDLQYLIYSLALHRYLGRRLPGYAYERHFGGVYYLFLRGMRAAEDTGVYFDRPSLTDIEALDSLFAQEREDEAARPACEARPCS